MFDNLQKWIARHRAYGEHVEQMPGMHTAGELPYSEVLLMGDLPVNSDMAKKAAYEAEWNELNARCGAVYPGHTCLTVGCINSHLGDTFKELHKCICDLEAVNNGGLELAFPSHSVMPTRLDLAIRGRLEKLATVIEKLNVEAEWHMARMAKEKNDA